MPRATLILLAFDESAALQLMDRALRAAGYATSHVADRKELGNAMQETTPALVFLGEKLAGDKGLEIAAQLLDRFPTLPLLLYTEQDTLTTLNEAMRLGVMGVLHPPLKTEDIVHTVERALRRARQLGDWVRREVKRTTSSLEQRVGEMDTLVKLGRDITATLDLDQVLNNVVTAAVELTGAEEGSLLLVDPESGDLYMRAGHNFEQEFADSFRLPVADTLAGRVLISGKPYLQNEATQKINTTFVVRALAYVPIRWQERVIGVLGVDNRERGHPFNEHHTQLMAVLADFAAIAIENARLYQESQAERTKFQAIFHNIQDGVLILDQQNRIQLANSMITSAFNRPSGELIGKPAVEALPHEDLRNLLQRDTETPLKYHEINFDDGRVFTAQLTPVPGVGVAITMQDITYLKELDRLKNDFVHTVSHDLRSPLTAVLGYTELLERAGPLADQQREFVRRIQSSVQNITELVNELLDLGRIEAGFDSHREAVHLDSIVRYTLEGLKPVADQRGQTIVVEIADHMPELRGNPIRLRQVADNLINNAIKYTPEGGTITIKLLAEAEQVIMEVADTGPGIPAADQAHIFEKFYRGSNVPNDVPGSGLGLAIVKTIVDGHQGRIWVESTVGQGSRFFVVLPTYGENH